MKYTKVCFKGYDNKYGGKEYLYRTNKKLDVKVGDLVIVDARGEVTIVQVSGFTNENCSGIDIYKKIHQIVGVKKIKKEQEKIAKKREKGRKKLSDKEFLEEFLKLISG